MRYNIFDFDQTITIKHSFKDVQLRDDEKVEFFDEEQYELGKDHAESGNIKLNVSEAFKFDNENISGIATFHNNPSFIAGYVSNILGKELQFYSIISSGGGSHVNAAVFYVEDSNIPILISYLPYVGNSFKKNKDKIKNKNVQILFLCEQWQKIQPFSENDSVCFYDDTKENCESALALSNSLIFPLDVFIVRSGDDFKCDQLKRQSNFSELVDLLPYMQTSHDEKKILKFNSFPTYRDACFLLKKRGVFLVRGFFNNSNRTIELNAHLSLLLDSLKNRELIHQKEVNDDSSDKAGFEDFSQLVFNAPKGEAGNFINKKEAGFTKQGQWRIRRSREQGCFTVDFFSGDREPYSVRYVCEIKQDEPIWRPRESSDRGRTASGGFLSAETENFGWYIYKFVRLLENMGYEKNLLLKPTESEHSEIDLYSYNIPSAVACPITLQSIKTGEGALLNGRLYSKSAITKWVTSRGTDPFTRKKVNLNDIRASRAGFQEEETKEEKNFQRGSAVSFFKESSSDSESKGGSLNKSFLKSR